MWIGPFLQSLSNRLVAESVDEDELNPMADNYSPSPNPVIRPS